MINHVVVRVYNNLEYVYNIVKTEHLVGHVEYNKVMRFGNALFVDGKKVYNGLGFTEERLKAAQKIVNKLKVDASKDPTIPYR